MCTIGMSLGVYGGVYSCGTVTDGGVHGGYTEGYTRPGTPTSQIPADSVRLRPDSVRFGQITARFRPDSGKNVHFRQECTFPARMYDSGRSQIQAGFRPVLGRAVLGRAVLGRAVLCLVYAWF